MVATGHSQSAASSQTELRAAHAVPDMGCALLPVTVAEAVQSVAADSMQHGRAGTPSLVLSSLPCEQQAVPNDGSGVCMVAMQCRLLHEDVYAWFSFNQLDHSDLLRSSIACADTMAWDVDGGPERVCVMEQDLIEKGKF